MIKRITAAFAVAVLLCSMISSVGAETAGQTTLDYSETTTASAATSEGQREIVIQSYLTNKETTETTIEACDIIFVIDQSKWMNTEDDNGAQRAAIITAMKSLVSSLAAPTEGEHRIAIAGYGRVNLGGGSDAYDSSIYPGVQSPASGVSFNTGYYTAEGFQSVNGWSDVSDMSTADLPTMPATYISSMTYDSAFMTADECDEVLNVDTMNAWYSGASRMDAGLSIAEQLAAVANANDTDSNRQLMVCIMASSLPIQNNAAAGKYIIRNEAVTAASQKLKDLGAAVFAFGDYHSSGKEMWGDMQDTSENFNAVMQSVCSGADNFYPLSGYSNVTQALNNLITNINVTSAGDAARSFTIKADTFTVPEDVTLPEGFPTETADDGTVTIAWEDIADYFADYSDVMLQNGTATVETFNFTGYDNSGEPTFSDTASVSLDVSLSDILTQDGISYTTSMIPLPPAAKTRAANAYYGYKVVITIEEPIVVDHKWVSDAAGYVPSDVTLPGNVGLVSGMTYTAGSLTTQDVHYGFNGWFLNADGTNQVTSLVPTQNTTVYGKWTQYVCVNYYYDIWNNGYATADSTASLVMGSALDPFTPASVAGYTFGGWYTDKNLTAAYTSGAATQDIDLYAKWTANENTAYTVKYYLENAAGGYSEATSDAVSASGTTGARAAYTANTYTGYTYSHTTYSDANRTEQAAELTIAADGSLTVHVYYTMDTYKVTYDGNGYIGEVPTDDAAYTYNSCVTVASDILERSGYLFMGWSMTADGVAQYAPGDMFDITADTTLYAVWQEIVLPDIPTTLPELPEIPEIPDLLNGLDHYAYIIGYTDGTIRPENNITRAEAAVIFFRLLKDEVRDGNLTTVNNFTDVSEGDWYNTAISTMASLGIIIGRTADTFEPDEYITRAELAAICARFDDGESDDSQYFTDIVGHWAEDEINRAACLGWAQGYTDSSFRPDEYITRAETVTMVNRVLQRGTGSVEGLHEDMFLWLDNLDEEAWYYLDIQEASCSHLYSSHDELFEIWEALNSNPDWKKYE